MSRSIRGLEGRKRNLLLRYQQVYVQVHKNFDICNEVGSGEKLKTKITKYDGIYIRIIGSAALEEARKLLTSAKRHTFTREKKIK